MSKQDYNNLESRISDEANTNVIRYREIFYNAAENNGALNEDANNWFEQSTARIKNIKGVAELQRAINSVNKVMGAIAKGQFESRIVEEFNGDLGQLKQSVNGSAEKVQLTMQALDSIMDALDQGDFSARMHDDVEGDLKGKVDNSMATLDAALGAVGDIFSKMSEGEFSQRIDMPLKGSLNQLKVNINHSLDGIESAMGTINMNGVFNELKNTMTSSLDALQGAITSLNDVASAQNNGELHKRMEGNHHGELANIQEAVNASMHNLSGIVKNVQDSSRKAADQ